MARVELGDGGGGARHDAERADAGDYVYDVYYHFAEDGAGG